MNLELGGFTVLVLALKNLAGYDGVSLCGGMIVAILGFGGMCHAGLERADGRAGPPLRTINQ